MTALDRYVRLEAAGHWRPTPDQPWQEVLVSFGNASLVLSSFDEEPLTHWALAATRRLGSDGAARYSPVEDGSEVLELEDPQMIEAIAEVTRDLGRRARRRRRLPWRGLALVFLVGALAVTVGPDFLRNRAFALISPDQAELISDQVLVQLGASPCAMPEGRESLSRLATRIAPATEVLVMPWAAPVVATLPDGRILLSRDAVEGAQEAESVAGWIAVGQAIGARGSGLGAWTSALAPAAAARFLISGQPTPDQIDAIARSTLATAPPGPEVLATATARLVDLSIDPAALTRAAGAATAARTLPPVIPSDRDWVALQNICSG